MRLNATIAAVGRLQASSQVLGTLARIAGDTAKRNVLSADHACVIDDVLPRPALTTLRGLGEVAGAIDACPISIFDFGFECFRDVPSVHGTLTFGPPCPNGTTGKSGTHALLAQPANARHTALSLPRKRDFAATRQASYACVSAVLRQEFRSTITGARTVRGLAQMSIYSHSRTPT